MSIAATPASIREVHALRYQVYCIEKAFEDPAANPGALEIDNFDHRSVHCLLRRRADRKSVGTARLILPNPLNLEASWPIQQICSDMRLLDDTVLPTRSTAEVSRFCLTRNLRLEPAVAGAADDRSEQAARRLEPFNVLGIIRGLLALSLENGISHWVLVVEPALLRLLGRFGLHFTKLGPVVDYHGTRQPCFARLDALIATMRHLQPEIWNVVTAGGEFAPPLSWALNGIGGNQTADIAPVQALLG